MNLVLESSLKRSENLPNVNRYILAKYSWILHLWLHLWAKIYLQPQINTHGVFMVIWKHAQSDQKRKKETKFSDLTCISSDEVKWREPLPFSSDVINKCSFYGLFGAAFFFFFFTYLCFLLMHSLFRTAPSTLLMFCLLSLSTKGL